MRLLTRDEIHERARLLRRLIQNVNDEFEILWKLIKKRREA